MATNLQFKENHKVDQWEFNFDTHKNLWSWIRHAPNGRVVGTSFKSYKNKKDCITNAIRNTYSYLTGKPTAFASTMDTGEFDQWQIQLKESGLWHWTRFSANGRVVGASHEGYKNKKDCEINAERHGYSKPHR